MTDYQQFIGGSTTMLIRDTGGWVEFWIQTGSQTWNNDQWWSYFANGVESRQKTRMVRGGNWQHFGSVYVTYDQNIRFTIEGAGLGFPTSDFWVHIIRSTVPAPPTMLSAQALSTTHIRVIFQGNGDGGSPIQEWQVGYGGSPNYPTDLWGSGGQSDIGPFNSGQLVYFWARGRNSVGWSNWSNRLQASTWRVPDPPTPVFFDLIKQTSIRAMFNGKFNGGTPVIEWQLGYGLDSGAPTELIVSSGTSDLVDLSPGRTYYFWARGRNSVGWGAWSEIRQATLIAGARVRTGNVWKRAVPYVRVNGVWKLTKPYVKISGVWKEIKQ